MSINNINDRFKMPKYVDDGECSRVVSFERNQKGQEDIVIWHNENQQTRILNDGSAKSFQKLFNALPSCPEVEFVPREPKDEKLLDELLDKSYLNNQ